jgi:hypothetical protein
MDKRGKGVKAMIKTTQKNATKITVASIKLNGNLVPVPVGLSELLESTWEVNPSRTNFMKDYRREVIKKGDRYVTVLKKNI